MNVIALGLTEALHVVAVCRISRIYVYIRTAMVHCNCMEIRKRAIWHYGNICFAFYVPFCILFTEICIFFRRSLVAVKVCKGRSAQVYIKGGQQI